MNDEMKDQAGAAATDTAAPENQPATAQTESETPQPAGKEFEPIAIELEDLTEEAKARAEKALHRPIKDIPYTVRDQQTRPGSVLALTFEVARPEYDEEEERRLNDVRKDVALPGFRKGKAPLSLLRRRLGESAGRDTIASVASIVLRQQVLAAGINFISKPQVIQFNLPAEGQESVTLEIEGEIEPTIEVKNYKGFTVQVEVQPLDEQRIEQRLERLRQENAVTETAPEGAVVNPGDMVTIDVEVINARGERLGNMSQQDRQVYDYQHSLPQPVAEQLTGKKVGESFEARVSNKVTNRRGEEIIHEDTWTVTVKEIKINKLPALDDEFAKDLGKVDTLAELKETIRKEIEADEEQRQRAETLQKLYRELVQANQIDPPRSLLTRQQLNLIMRDRQELSRMGLRLEHVVHDPDRYLTDQRQSAEEQVRIQLLLTELARTEQIQVTDEELDQEIAQIAERTGRKPLAIRARLEANRELDGFRSRLLQRKLDDLLLANNTVEKVPAKPPEEAPQAEATPDAEPQA